MAAENRRFRFCLKGSPTDEGNVRLDDLKQFIEQVLTALRSLERDLSEDAAGSTEAVPDPAKKDADDLGPELVSTFRSGLSSVARGEAPEGFSVETLERMQGLCSVLRRNVDEIEFQVEGQSLSLPADWDLRIRKLLGTEFHSHGSYRGRLEAVNLHASPPLLYIYPITGPSRIRCRFKRERVPGLGDLLEKWVDVRGVLKYRGEDPFPLEIEVEEIRPLRDETTLPSVDDLLGSAPSATGELSTAEWLRMLRDDEAAA